jgi:hypothetical protein
MPAKENKKIAATKKRKTELTLPKEDDFRNHQLELFQSFLCNNEAERDKLSNTVDLWDSIPKYSVSRQAMHKLRSEGGFLELLKLEFKYRGKTFQVIIQPARIKEDDGTTRDYYPGANEELIEDALRKIAADQYQGYFDKPNFRSGVVFSLYILRRELTKRGHARSYQEIVKSLKILSGSLIEIRSPDGDETQAFSRANYLPALAAVSKYKLQQDHSAKWVVQFHPLVTRSIDALTYHQYNYHQMMAQSTQLARWIHKQLSLKYTFANYDNVFEILYSTIRRDSAMINYKRDRDGIVAVDKAFQELQGCSVIIRFEKREMLGSRGKIQDVRYVLYPSPDFIRGMKAANKRLSNATNMALGKSANNASIPVYRDKIR